MNMEIRPLSQDDLDQGRALASIAFNRGHRKTPRPDDERHLPGAYGLFDDHRLQAAARAIPFEVYFGGQVVKMGGVADVMCHPASRRRGYAGMLVRRLLEHMKEEGQTLSCLFPFSYIYYRKLGWDWIGRQLRYKIGFGHLPHSAEASQARIADPSDLAAIQAIYSRYAGGYRGCIVRDERAWNELLNPESDPITFVYLFESNGEPKGYLVFQLGEGYALTSIREMVALTSDGYRGFLGLLRRHEMQVGQFEWSAPSDDVLWDITMEHGVNASLYPMTMGRVVDAEAALSWLAINPAIEGRVRISVQDEAAAWNSRRWVLEAGDGHMQVNSTAEAADIELDIQAFSQAFWGVPDLVELRCAGRISVHNEEAFRLLVAALSGPPVWMMDSF